MAKKSQIDEILEVGIHIKDVMATKHKLNEVKDRVYAIEGKLDGINIRIENEVDYHKGITVRIDKLEKKVFK